MKTYPKISLVTQCFNREDYIAETIESVLSQQYPNLEYIVIDDGSTDASWEIIRRYQKYLAYGEQWPGVRKTPIPAINRGFTHATGEVLGWLNTKNTLLPKSLSSIGEMFEAFPEIEWLTGLATTINNKSQIVKVATLRKNIYDYLIGDWQTIQQESTFWRRSLWERAGGSLREEYPWSFDTALWVKFFQHAELYHAQTVFGTYRKIKGGQSVASRDVYMEYTRRALNELRKDVSPTMRRRAIVYRMLHLLRPFMASISDAAYLRLPLPHGFSHLAVSYHFGDEQWHIQKRNPFRL